MKKILITLLLICVENIATAEYVTILPIKGSTSEMVSEITSLSELYGKTATLRYWSDSPVTKFAVALTNTNINPSDALKSNADILPENELFGFYVGAAKSDVKSERQVSESLLSMEDPAANFLSKNRSAVALAALIEEKANSAYNALEASPLSTDSPEDDFAMLALNSDLNADSSLLSSNSGSSIIDTLLSGIASNREYELPASLEHILISGLGGAILNDSGVGLGGGSGMGADGVHAPEPATWLMLLFGVAGLMYYRKANRK